ncbi:hypothetical protein ACFVVU_10080 [Kitasatospora sp. NPDC057965]|uniref:hypothetical protein n=1 Tax=Kitasatospora sp. NPDC057965 TaxID=3346291 RepID=UPI0036DE4134
MSGEPVDGGPAVEHVNEQAQVTIHQFLVTADPGEVATRLATEPGPAARLAAAVYRASAQTHGTADAATRRQILALDAARFGDRALSAGLAAVSLPRAPDTRWRVDWATGSGVHPRFLGLLGAAAGPPPLVDGDGRPVDLFAVRHRVRVWDLSGDPVVSGELAFPEPVGALAVTTDGRVLAGFGHDLAVLSPC